MAAGAERIAIFKLQDTESDKLANPEPFGLLRRDGSRRPAFYAYRTASTLLANGEATTRERWDSVGQIRIDQPSLEQSTTVLFSRLPSSQTAKIPATTDRAYLRDLTGSRAENDIFANEGFFTVELPPSTCYQPIGDYCMIGGPTFYLIQYRDPALPAVTPAPTVMATAMATSTPMPTSTPSPTETIAPTVTATAMPTATDTAVPTAVLPTSTPSPVPTTETAVNTTSTSGLYLLGGGLLMGLLILGLWFRQR
jgi:cell division septation protein DedD